MLSPRHLSGTKLAGTLHLDRAAVHDLLRLSSSQPVSIEIQAQNRILVRYKMFHAHAALPARVQVGSSPQLTVRLDSVVVAMGLKAVVRESFVSIRGRDVTISLAEVPALRPWREWLPHVRSVELSTDAGGVGARFLIEIPE